MDNFIFSVNVVLPIFLMIVLGSVLTGIGILDEEMCAKLLRLVFYVSLPASLFRSVAEADIREVMSPAFISYAVGCTLLIFFLGWMICRLFLREKKQVAAAAHAAYRGNFAYVGIPVCQNLLGKENVPVTAAVIAFVVPVYNILAVLLLSHYDEEGGSGNIGKELLKILKNPLIIAIAAGIPFSFFRIPIAQPVMKTLAYIAQLASPLALLLIGANLNPAVLRSGWKGIALTTLIKDVLSPLICTCGAVLLGFRGEELAVLFVMAAVPSAANSYIMTRQMHGDAVLGAGAVAATSLFCIVSMTAGIMWMRSLGLV